MAKYSYITDKSHNNRKIQVESAKRDGSGKNIENNYAKQNGNYQSLTAGLSNNFDTKLVMGDESAYNFRPTATMGSVELEVGSPCKVKKIVGGSVAFNQLIPLNVLTTKDVNGVTITNNNDGSWTLDGTATDNIAEYITGAITLVGKVLFGISNISTPIEKVFIRDQYSYTSSSNKTQVVDVFNGTCAFALIIKQGAILSNVRIIPQAVDLTQMFGSTIADYIYSLEQANAGSGVAWFKRYFPKEYYAYNSGELVSVKTQGKKITHFNQFNKETATIGKYVNPLNGELVDGANYCASDYIRVVGGATYYLREIGTSGSFSEYASCYDADKNYLSALYVPINGTIRIPSNAVYIRTTCSKSAIDSVCLNFHYDGERDGEYEPYNSETYACDDDELRGIPQLDDNNNIAFDGDEYLADGTKNVRYKESQFSQDQIDGVDASVFYTQLLGVNCYDINKFTDAKDYGEYKTYAIADKIEFAIYKGSYNGMYVFGEASVNSYIAVLPNMTLEQAKTFLASLTVIYELATPTEETTTPFTEVQECDNWGTEEWLAPTTDTRPCEVPVGHETDYLPDLKAKLEVAPSTPNENGVYVMEHNASGNSYTPIATWLTDNGYVKPTSISGYDNTKTQTLKNVEGTLTWVDDE